MGLPTATTTAAAALDRRFLKGIPFLTGGTPAEPFDRFAATILTYMNDHVGPPTAHGLPLQGTRPSATETKGGGGGGRRRRSRGGGRSRCLLRLLVRPRSSPSPIPVLDVILVQKLVPKIADINFGGFIILFVLLLLVVVVVSRIIVETVVVVVDAPTTSRSGMYEVLRRG